MRYQMSEGSYIVVSFPTGHTVTIDVYKLSDNSKVVSAASMTEIGTTGMYKYAQSLAPIVKTEYLYVATDTYDVRSGKIVLGGYPDTITTSQTNEEGYISTINGNISTILSDIGTILSDIGTIQSDVSTIKSDISTIKSDESTIKSSQVAEEAAISLISIATLGDGSVAKRYGPLTDENGLPIADAQISVYSDATMQNRIAFDLTNQYGYTQYFQLDPGTVYVKRSKTGYVFTNPDVEVVP